jgi:tetratricopeptide (TPR) repeat protein
MIGTMSVEEIYQKGFQCRCDGQYAEAKSYFQRVLASDANHIKTLHQLALIMGYEGDFDGSLASLERLCNQVPSDLDVRYDLAMTQMMLGLQDEACANFRLILSKDPDHAKALQQINYC